jgi:LacI family transcriptional regulator
VPTRPIRRVRRNPPRRVAPNLSAVARRAGTSTATVSRALTTPTVVSEDLRRRVLGAAEELGYVVHRAGRALAAGRSGLVGLIARADDVVDWSMIVALRRRLEAEGKGLLLEVHGGTGGEELDCARRLLGWAVDGVVLVGAGAGGEETRRALEGAGVPGVLCGGRGPGWCSVDFDLRGAGATAIQYLSDLGHRRVALVHGPPGQSKVSELTAGVADALDAAGLSLPLAVDVSDGDVETRLAEAVGGDRADTMPTAFLSTDRAIAGRVRAWLRGRGLEAPARVSLVTLEDDPATGDPTQATTSLRASAAELGRRTAEYLIAQTPGASLPQAFLLPVKLVIRGSTGPAQR